MDLVTVNLLGTDIQTLSLRNLVPYLCAHGWTQLKWICDLAELMRNSTDLDWDQIIHRAEKLRSLRMLWLGLALATELLDAPLPVDICQQIYKEKAIPSLLIKAKKQLFSEEVRPKDRDYHLFYHNTVTSAVPLYFAATIDESDD